MLVAAHTDPALFPRTSSRVIQSILHSHIMKLRHITIHHSVKSGIMCPALPKSNTAQVHNKASNTLHLHLLSTQNRHVVTEHKFCSAIQSPGMCANNESSQILQHVPLCTTSDLEMDSSVYSQNVMPLSKASSLPKESYH